MDEIDENIIEIACGDLENALKDMYYSDDNGEEYDRVNNEIKNVSSIADRLVK